MKFLDSFLTKLFFSLLRAGGLTYSDSTSDASIFFSIIGRLWELAMLNFSEFPSLSELDILSSMESKICSTLISFV